MTYKFLYQSKIGNLILKSDGEYLTGIEFEDPNNPLLFSLLIAIKAISDTISYLDAYFNNSPLPKLPPMKLDICEFDKNVLEIVSNISYGKTMTYKEISNLYNEKYKKNISPIAVGKALSRNPILILIPCHRVVGENNIGGYSNGVDKKILLLKNEGIIIC